MFSHDRRTLRNMYAESWRKYQQGHPLEPLEQVIASLLLIHPEYQAIFEKPDSALDKDYHPQTGEVNPFLHLSLHLSILDQLKTDRPKGIVDIYTRLLKKHGNEHDVTHCMMDILQDTLWLAQKNNQAPDEAHYYTALCALVESALLI